MRVECGEGEGLLAAEREREGARTIIVLRLLSNGSINTKFRSGCAEDNEDSVSRNAVSIWLGVTPVLNRRFKMAE